MESTRHWSGFCAGSVFNVKQSLSLLLIVGVAMVTLAGLFQAMPTLDLQATMLFCGAPVHGAVTGCTRFVVADSMLAQIVRRAFLYLPVLAVSALVVLVGFSFLFRRAGLASRLHAIVLCAYFIGPILIVNGLFKSYSGRPRPHETIDFGGDLPFFAMGDFSGPCGSNCSFASGEAAASGWLLWILPLLPSSVGRFPRALIIAASVATPVLRMAMGGHYLSDAAIGWLVGVSSVPATAILGAIIRSLLRRRPIGA